VPSALASLVITADFNDADGVRELLGARGEEIAAVIVEPVAGNMGVVAPLPGFLETLRRETAKSGTVLIFDEVITGFRLGWSGAQGRCGVTPDLTCLGKVIGGGLPLAAVGGRRDLMQLLAPVGPVYQAGTLSGNPLSVACGLATLKTLRDTPAAYDRLEELGALAEHALRAAADGAGVPACVNRVGSMLTLFLGVRSVAGLDHALRADTERFGRYFRAMLADGVYLPPSQFEALFVSLAHGEADVDQLGLAAKRALAAS
jgi:glutamate-1-semialdehyde 2,1-aminomutase